MRTPDQSLAGLMWPWGHLDSTGAEVPVVCEVEVACFTAGLVGFGRHDVLRPGDRNLPRLAVPETRLHA